MYRLENNSVSSMNIIHIELVSMFTLRLAVNT